MVMIRDDEQMALAELHQQAAGTLMRYRELREADFDSGLRQILETIVEQRKPLVARLAGRAQARNDQPKAPDTESYELNAVIDRVVQYLGGSDRPALRLLDNEIAWRGTLRSYRALQWDSEEQALITDLIADVESAIDELNAYVVDT